MTMRSATRHTEEESMASPPTIADLRAQIARQQAHRYKLAAEVGIHPARFGRMLNEREPMPRWVYENTCEALRVIRGPSEAS
jgi:hypothetical protein